MNGVVAYIKTTKTGVTKLYFDDVRSEKVSKPEIWEYDVFYTVNKYDSHKIENMKLSKEQYAEIGENLILRLLALNGNYSITCGNELVV